MLKSILISLVMLLLLASLTYSQTETAEQKTGFRNEVKTEKKIPQYLLDQLETAQRTENIEEENRIMNILNSKYLDVTFYNSFVPNNAVVGAGEDENVYNPPYNPDWNSTDVEVYAHSGSQTNVTNRTLDIEYCEESRRLYIAACVNISGFHGIRVYSSNNAGLTWILEGFLQNNSTYWTGLSMKVEQRRNGYLDSIRVNIFYTESTYSGGSSARLGFLSFRPHASSAAYVFKIIGTPTSGYKFMWPSAYSNGQFESSSTDIGCIVGEYNNSGTTCYRMRQFFMWNWSWNFSITTNNTGYNDFRPSAVYKNNPSGVDSVYIATERRFGSQYEIRLLKTRYYGGVSSPAWSYVAITNTPSMYEHNPCLTIPQNRYPTRLAITYTRNITTSPTGYGRCSHSYNGGFAWSHNSLGFSATTRYTGVSSDSNGSVGYCTFIWGDSDSLNVRRGNIVSGTGGAYYYDRASYSLTSTCFPVCAVYNNSSGNHRRSTFAYWRYLIMTGVKNIFFDAENLSTGITNTNSIANDYSLSQNFPNPFNPTTTIKFSIPQAGLVKLVVFDVLGKEVATLVNKEQTAGNYEVTFDASKLTSGVYFYKITSGDFVDVKKMLLIK